MFFLGSAKGVAEASTQLFPNPTIGRIGLEGNHLHDARLSSNFHDLFHSSDGIYLIRQKVEWGGFLFSVKIAKNDAEMEEAFHNLKTCLIESL